MTTSPEDAWRPETSEDRVKSWGAFIITGLIFAPALGALAGWGVRSFTWAAGL